MGEFIPHAEHGGFLHPYPLSKIEGVSEEELIEQNHAWAQRLEESSFSEEIESWTDFFGPNPYGLVTHELTLRKNELGEKCTSYYERFNEGGFTLHNMYEEDKRWPINLDKAKKNHEKRMQEKLAEMSPEDRAMHEMLSRMPKRVLPLDFETFQQSDGTILIRFHDKKTGKTTEIKAIRLSP